MPKHARKRQKTDIIERSILGVPSALTDETAKDDEERRLEQLLFGTPYESGTTKGLDWGIENSEDVQGNELEHMMDTDVRVLQTFLSHDMLN